jgi:Ca2+-binding RTX toxin-like protein
VLTSLAEGSDTVSGVELLRFADGDMTFEEFTAGMPGPGDDSFAGTAADDALDGQGGADTLDGLGGQDLLSGGDGADRLLGGAGLDTLQGGEGGDTLEGGAGVDSFAGGAGGDLYIVDAAAEAVTEVAGGGADTVRSTVSLTLAAEVEALVLTGSAAEGTGNALANHILGNAAANRLDGGAGADTLEGGAGNDLYLLDQEGDLAIDSGGGSDTIQAAFTATLTDGFEALVLTGSGGFAGTGNAGANAITGNSGANALGGAAGDDTIAGGGGNDAIDGGAGTGDVAVFSDTYASYAITHASGSFTIAGGADGSDIVSGVEIFRFADGDRTAFQLASRLPSSGADWLVGTEGEDSIAALAGDDTVEGLGDKDFLQGEAGNDSLLGGAGEDRLSGSSGADTLDGGADKDEIQGEDGDDRLLGGAAEDKLQGGAGHDTLDGGGAKDDMEGGAGDDTYIVDHATDVPIENQDEGFDTVQVGFSYTLQSEWAEALTLTGSGAISGTGTFRDNRITGNAGSNTLRGEDGDDTLAGGNGDDSLAGGNGTDIAVLAGARADYVFTLSGGTYVGSGGGEGTDRFSGIEVFRFADGDVLAAELIGAPPPDPGTDDSLLGTTGADVLDGRGGDDTLEALAGNDSLTGGGGNDSLLGGGGADSMAGGDGDDLYHVDTSGDLVVEAAGAGADTVAASVTHSLAANLEALVLLGAGAIGGTGNTLANRITGNAGANALNGGAGADTLTGGAGDDLYTIDNAGDLVVEAEGEGADTIQSSVSATLGEAIEKLVLTGSAALSGTGHGGDDHLVGNSGANTLSGLGGADTLDGGSGSDRLVGGAGDDLHIVAQSSDVVVEEAGEGLDTVRASVTWTLGAEIEVLELTGSSTLRGTGNGLDNRIAGNSGANTLSGLDGADSLAGAGGADSLTGGVGEDTLLGGAGNDSLNGGAGTDAFRFAARTEGRDTVADFVSGTDRIEVLAVGFDAVLALGALDPARLTLGSAASGTGAQFVYNGATGALGWDLDGAGAGAAVQIATFTTRPALTAADFLVVA